MNITITINIKSTVEESLWLPDTNSSVEPDGLNALLDELNSAWDSTPPPKGDNKEDQPLN